MKRKVKRYDGGGNVVRTRTDDEIAEDSKFGGYGRYMPKTKEYSLDEVKGKLSGLFGGSGSDSSKFSELESVGGPGRRARSVEEQIGRRAETKPEPKAEVKTEPKEPDSVAGEGARNLALEKDDTPAPVKKAMKVVKKAEPKSKPYPEETRAKAKVGAGYEAVTEALREKEKEKERKKGQGLTPYAKGEKFTGSIEDWASKIKKAREAKQSGMKKGGAVSSASTRGDGIAQRGKTRGRMV